MIEEKIDKYKSISIIAILASTSIAFIIYTFIFKNVFYGQIVSITYALIERKVINEYILYKCFKEININNKRIFDDINREFAVRDKIIFELDIDSYVAIVRVFIIDENNDDNKIRNLSSIVDEYLEYRNIEYTFYKIQYLRIDDIKYIKKARLDMKKQIIKLHKDEMRRERKNQ